MGDDGNRADQEALRDALGPAADRVQRNYITGNAFEDGLKHLAHEIGNALTDKNDLGEATESTSLIRRFLGISGDKADEAQPERTIEHTSYTPPPRATSYRRISTIETNNAQCADRFNDAALQGTEIFGFLNDADSRHTIASNTPLRQRAEAVTREFHQLHEKMQAGQALPLSRRDIATIERFEQLKIARPDLIPREYEDATDNRLKDIQNQPERYGLEACDQVGLRGMDLTKDNVGHIFKATTGTTHSI